MKFIRKNYICIIATLCSLVFLLNFVLVKPVSNKYILSTTNTLSTTDIEVPETKFKVTSLDKSLIEEDEKHKAVSSEINESEDITEEDLLNFEILTLIYNNIAYDLSYQGFEVFESTALDLQNNLSYFGLTYSDGSVIEDNYLAAGFVSIISDENIVPENIDLVSLNNGEKEDYRYIILNQDIEKNNEQFIYCGKYIKYNWINNRTIKYSILDNVKQNYDKNLGRIYSYDSNLYVYDDDFTYTSQEVSLMFNEIDFDQLQKTLDEINAEQNKNGYYVQELTITYIDNDLIKEWERSLDKDSFYGYDLEELNKTFGASTTLEFTSEGVKQAALIETPKPTNWLKVGLMALIGCAAILIGAAIAPLTGGCSFGAALLCIVKMTAIAVATDLLVKTTVSTISGVVKGQNFFDALGDSIKSTFTVENIAQSFMTSAIMSAVMVGSGLVKACFIEGTPVLTENGYKNIEELKIGDKVISYDEISGLVGVQAVTKTFINSSDDICTIALSSGEVITSTSLHPWYVLGKGWVPAFSLTSEDILLTSDNNNVSILGVNRQKLDTPVNVYNITVNNEEDDSYHTYFVGNDNVLVHNSCTKISNSNGNKKIDAKTIRSERQKAVREAWKREVEAVKNNTSKYNWTPKQLKQLQKYGKVKGFNGCHIYDVSKNTSNLKLIGDPDNIVFLKRFGNNSHFYIHHNNWRNATDISRVKDILPWVTERIEKLLKYI